MLLAEELEIDIDAIQIVAAPVGDAYISPGNGGQITGTSNSVQESWDKLRMAGATARTMLIARCRQALARRSGAVPRQERHDRQCPRRGADLRRAGRGGREAARAQGREAEAEERISESSASRGRASIRPARSTAAPNSASTSSCPECCMPRSRKVRCWAARCRRSIPAPPRKCPACAR